MPASRQTARQSTPPTGTGPRRRHLAVRIGAPTYTLVPPFHGSATLTQIRLIYRPDVARRQPVHQLTDGMSSGARGIAADTRTYTLTNLESLLYAITLTARTLRAGHAVQPESDDHRYWFIRGACHRPSAPQFAQVPVQKSRR